MPEERRLSPEQLRNVPAVDNANASGQLPIGSQVGVVVEAVGADDDVARLFAGVRRALRPRGVFVVDAFVPRPAMANPDFTLDYRRPYDGGSLVRSKRVTPLPDGRNRIERRSEVVAGDGRGAGGRGGCVGHRSPVSGASGDGRRSSTGRR